MDNREKACKIAKKLVELFTGIESANIEKAKKFPLCNSSYDYATYYSIKEMWEEVLQKMEALDKFATGAFKGCYFFNTQYVIKWNLLPYHEDLASVEASVWEEIPVKYRRSFPKTEIIWEGEGFCFILQERGITYEEQEETNYFSRSATQFLEDSGLLDEYNSPLTKNYVPDGWLVDLFEDYGQEEIQSFNAVLEDFCINDLHEGNVGYLHGVPVILDFAGA